MPLWNMLTHQLRSCSLCLYIGKWGTNMSCYTLQYTQMTIVYILWNKQPSIQSWNACFKFYVNILVLLWIPSKPGTSLGVLDCSKECTVLEGGGFCECLWACLSSELNQHHILVGCGVTDNLHVLHDVVEGSYESHEVMAGHGGWHRQNAQHGTPPNVFCQGCHLTKVHTHTQTHKGKHACMRQWFKKSVKGW